MAEVKDMEQTAEKVTYGQEAPPKPKLSKKKKKWIRRGIALAVVAAIALGAVKLLGEEEGGETEIISETVTYGAITATVEGSGLTKAKKRTQTEVCVLKKAVFTSWPCCPQRP